MPAGRPGSSPSGVAREKASRRGEMSTQGSSKLAFGKAASKLDVAESDYLVLTTMGINTFSTLAFRFPKAEDWESFMGRTVRPQGAFRDGESVRVFTKADALTLEEFKESEDAACLRKLWTLAAKVAKAEVEDLAGVGEEPKQKVSAASANELEDSAVKGRKMPAPTGDRERPSLWTLSKVQQNLSPQGDHRHLTWEAYVSMDTESRLRRAGKLPRDSQELILSGKEIQLKAGDMGDFPTAKISDVTSMQEALEIRARALCVLGHADYSLYRKLTDFYVSKLRDLPPEGFRAPTLNEVRKCDRVLHEELLHHVSKSVGSLNLGIEYHLKRPDHSFWKLIDKFPESTPDQGLDPKDHTKKEKSGGDPPKVDPKKRQFEQVGDAGGVETPPVKMRMCLVCQKRHEPRCPLPEDFRKTQREKEKARKAKAKASGAKKA